MEGTQPRKIAILHQMARTGGTLICKCLGSMGGVALFSELHPDDRSFCPVRQALDWHALLTPEETANVTASPYAEILVTIDRRAEAMGLSLLLRDWSHVDFTETSSLRPRLYEELRETFEIQRFCTVRHPLRQWSSLCKLMDKRYEIRQFIKGYLAFARMAKEVGFVRYENFTEEPDASLREICTALGLRFDPGWRRRWADYSHVTGDSSTARQIRPASLARVPESDLNEFRRNPDYAEALNVLGYEDL